MQPGDVFALLIAVSVPTILMIYVFRRWFTYKEKQLEVQARTTAERAAEYAASNTELEQRVRVLEHIVTDNGAQTAAQIEALRGDRRLKGEDPVPTSTAQ